MQKFEFEAEEDGSLLIVRLVGFWTTGDVAEFIAAEQAAVRDLRCPPGAHLVLADLTAFSLQSQEVVEHCARFIGTASLKAMRLALMLGPGLSWMQVKRMLVRDRIAAFDDERSARSWLFSGNKELERGIDDLLAQRAHYLANKLRD